MGFGGPRPGRFTSWKGSRYPFYKNLGGPQGRSGRMRETSPPTGIRFPYRPARSQSLYRLSYPGPPCVIDERMYADFLWDSTDGGKRNYLARNVYRCFFFHSKTKIMVPGMKIVRTRRDAGDYRNHQHFWSPQITYKYII